MLSRQLILNGSISAAAAAAAAHPQQQQQTQHSTATRIGQDRTGHDGTPEKNETHKPGDGTYVIDLPDIEEPRQEQARLLEPAVEHVPNVERSSTRAPSAARVVCAYTGRGERSKKGRRCKGLLIRYLSWSFDHL